MNFLVEAAPELLISLVIVVLLYWLTKEKLASQIRRGIVYTYVAGLLITVILLFQSNSKPNNTLQVQESEVSSELELSDVKDLSPETLSSEQSSKRLKALIEQQKDDVSVAKDDSGD